MDVLILQIQTCCEGLNLQQFSEVYFVSPDWNPSIEDQAIARCHRFGQTEPVIVFRFTMASFKIPATPETQHLLEAQRERELQNADDGRVGDHNDDNNCIDFDTIETYTANIQNKKRIFADEILRA